MIAAAGAWLLGCGGAVPTPAGDPDSAGDVGTLDAADELPDTPAVDLDVQEATDVPGSTDESSSGATDIGSETTWTCNEPGHHEPAYDHECVGNVGCKELTCEACATSCVRCDGPYCVATVSDDSCMTGPPWLQPWAGEPVAGVPVDTTQVLLTAQVSFQGLTVALDQPPPLPTEAKWQAAGVQSQILQPPVTVVDDRVLVYGTWSLHNFCTGETLSGTTGPLLHDIGDRDGDLNPGLGSLHHGDHLRVAWLRVYQDATGERFVQWLQVPHSAPAPQVALVSYPLPLAVATPVQTASGPFDYAKVLAK